MLKLIRAFLIIIATLLLVLLTACTGSTGGVQTSKNETGVPSAAPEPSAAKPTETVDTPLLFSSMQIGDVIQFGEYEWRVLDIQGSKALIVTVSIVERGAYNEEYADITWADCTVRTYLNTTFYDSFSSVDKSRILETNNINASNPWYGIEGGEDTTDKIFLLSLDDVVKYFGDSGLLANKPSEETRNIDDAYNSNRLALYQDKADWWCLRTPGENRRSVAGVGNDGKIYVDGLGRALSVDGLAHGIRPAMWIMI